VVDEALQALRELLRIYDPVAQAGMVVVAGAEPSVVHHEQLDSQFGGLVRQLVWPASLTLKVVAPTSCRAPDAGAKRRRPQNLFPLKAVQRARGAAEAALGEAA